MPGRQSLSGAEQARIELLLSVIVHCWDSTPEQIVENDLHPAPSSWDWDLEILEALADLACITENDSDIEKVKKLLTDSAYARVERMGFEDGAELLDVEDVEFAIEQFGGERGVWEQLIEEQEQEQEEIKEPPRTRERDDEPAPKKQRVATPEPESELDSLFGASPPPSPRRSPRLAAATNRSPPKAMVAARASSAPPPSAVSEQSITLPSPPQNEPVNASRRQLLRERYIRDLELDLQEAEAKSEAYKYKGLWKEMEAQVIGIKRKLNALEDNHEDEDVGDEVKAIEKQDE